MPGQIAIGLAGGAALAGVFLGGLWLSATKMAGSGRRVTLLVGTGLLRVFLVSAGFVALTRFAGPVALAAALVTFLLVRVVVVARIRTSIVAAEG